MSHTKLFFLNHFKQVPENKYSKWSENICSSNKWKNVFRKVCCCKHRHNQCNFISVNKTWLPFSFCQERLMHVCCDRISSSKGWAPRQHHTITIVCGKSPAERSEEGGVHRRIETGFKVTPRLILHHFSPTTILQWSAACFMQQRQQQQQRQTSPEIPSQTKRKQQHYGSWDKRERIKVWPFLLKTQEALREAHFCRLHPLQLQHVYIKAREGVEKCFEKITSSYLQFGGGSSVISASSFWILEQTQR